MNIQNLPFTKRCLYGFLFCFLSLFIADAIHFAQLYSIAWTLFGITFFIWPSVPDSMEEKWSATACRRFSWLFGILLIIGGWMATTLKIG